jgi:hypothetical protein
MYVRTYSVQMSCLCGFKSLMTMCLLKLDPIGDYVCMYVRTVFRCHVCVVLNHL